MNQIKNGETSVYQSQGEKIFSASHIFDHAKANQSKDL